MLSDRDIIPDPHENLFSVKKALKKGSGKIPLRFALTREWKTMAEKDLFLPPSPTRVQTTPLFWALEKRNP